MQRSMTFQLLTFLGTLLFIGLLSGFAVLTSSGSHATEMSPTCDPTTPHGDHDDHVEQTTKRTHSKAHDLERGVDRLILRLAEEHPEPVIAVHRRRCGDGDTVACGWVQEYATVSVSDTGVKRFDFRRLPRR